MTGEFDPRDWLRRFEAVGGWFVVRPEKTSIGWLLGGEHDAREARKVYREIECNPERREAIRDMLCVGRQERL